MSDADIEKYLRTFLESLGCLAVVLTDLFVIAMFYTTIKKFYVDDPQIAFGAAALAVLFRYLCEIKWRLDKIIAAGTNDSNQ